MEKIRDVAVKSYQNLTKQVNGQYDTIDKQMKTIQEESSPDFCFAIILRFYQGGEFKEIHVKVFNTGKLEIPGLLND